MIECIKCKHYRVTYDAKAPRGCSLYNVKTQKIPSVVVKEASGMDCQGFEKRKTLKDKKELNPYGDD